jgi:predicted HTH domain antitoxin
MLAEVQTSSTPATNKVVVIREILRASLPPDSQLAAGLLPDENGPFLSTKDIDEAITTVRKLLPMYDDTAEDAQQRESELVTSVKNSVMSSYLDLDKRIKTEVEQSLRDPARETSLRTQIDDQVFKVMNERFTKAPWFQIAIAAAAVAITLFSFGLVNLNKDVKRADQVVTDFQNRLAKADQDLTRDERDSYARLNASADNAVTKISQLQSDSMKGMNAELQKRIIEVDSAKKDALHTIDKSTQGVKDQAVLATPDIEHAKQIAINDINAEREKQLAAYRASASKIIADLREPTIRNVMGKAFWLMIATMIISLLSLAASVMLLVVEFRS